MPSTRFYLSLLLTAFAMLSAGSAAAASSVPAQRTAIPEPSFVFNHNSRWQWVEFCPDNTCEVLKTSASADSKMFKLLAKGHFYYHSGYAYLKDWQANDLVGEQLDRALHRSLKRTCAARAGVALLACAKQEFSPRVEVLELRFDEGAVLRNSVPWGGRPLTPLANGSGVAKAGRN